MILVDPLIILSNDHDVKNHVIPQVCMLCIVLFEQNFEGCKFQPKPIASGFGSNLYSGFSFSTKFQPKPSGLIIKFCYHFCYIKNI